MKTILFTLTILLSCGTAASQTVSQLLKTSWHQKSPFNDQCPLVNNAAPAAGCGAIAVGQILNYYKKPAHGFGHVNYTTKGNTVDIDYTTRTFDYDNILNYYASNATAASKEAVASLIYQVGAAMKMQYDTSSSPSNFPSMLWGLQHYLHFSPQSRYRNRRYYSTAEWIEMLNKELTNGHPVFYRGTHTAPGTSAGHIFVLDGINSTGKYHANFGHASSTQDKYVDLSIINQSSGTNPGVYNVCYHHQQAMITDFYPEEGLTDKDYDPHALVINSPIILNSDPYAKTVTATGTVNIGFRMYNANFVSSSHQYSIGFYKDGVLVANSSTIRNFSLGAGYYTNIKRTFNLPTTLANGQYEMAVISRENAASPWIRAWDNAPNCVPVTVQSNGKFIFTLPNYHNLDCNLYLEKNIKEPSDGKSGGKTFELTVCNPSSNNFEDTLRFEITASGTTKVYDMPTSIYDGQKITYRFFVKESDINMIKGYSVKAYYKETIANKWIQLKTDPTGIKHQTYQQTGQVCIYSITGQMLRKFDRTELERKYSSYLQSLPCGIYLISDNNGTRKFVKPA
ncbi:MAG TPA: hypothetical protein DCG33_05285 [Prevotellaceae bacterium]|nr:hypothetical protein [Prevotellaceae bacterium]